MCSWSGLSVYPCLRLNLKNKKLKSAYRISRRRNKDRSYYREVIVSEIQRENAHINTRNKREERIDKGRTPSVD